jgi:hypothetical protein
MDTESLNGISNDARLFCASLLGLTRFQEHRLPVPSSILRNDLRILSRKRYVVAPKQDGVRNLLLLGWSPTLGFYTTLIERCGRTKAIAYTSPEIFDHQGTLLDGELMSDGRFVVFDAYASSGYNLKACSLSDRLRAAGPSISRIRQAGPALGGKCVFMPELKDFKDATETTISEAWALGCSSGYDGIILAPAIDTVELGRLASYFKLKPKTHHTIDLLYTPSTTAGKLRFQCANGESLPFCVDLESADYKKAKRGVVEFALTHLTEQTESGKQLTLLWQRNRHDKTSANSRFVVDRTVQNLLEDVKVDDVVNALG